MSVADKYKGSGDVIIDAVYIVIDEGTHNEDTIDLSQLFEELVLCESIDDFCMSGTISILDGYNLRDNAPIYGGERINIVFHTTGAPDHPIQYTGIVYNISAPAKTSEHVSAYSIHFVSDFQYVNARTYVNSALTGNVSEIVQRIANKREMLAGKRFVDTPTKGITKYTFGRERPATAIAYAMRGAVSAQAKSGYVFFENNKEFRFHPITELYASEPVTEYTYRVGSFFQETDQRHVEKFNAIQEYEVLEDSDMMSRIREGQHGATWVYLDILNKKIHTKYYDRETQYTQTDSLGSLAVKKNISNGQYTDNTFFAVVANEDHLPINDYHTGVMNRRQSETIRLRITTYGDSGIKAGDTCIATLPDIQMNQGDGSRMIRGKFLISAIKHIVRKNSYMQTIELRKDAYEKI